MEKCRRGNLKAKNRTTALPFTPKDLAMRQGWDLSTSGRQGHGRGQDLKMLGC